MAINRVYPLNTAQVYDIAGTTKPVFDTIYNALDPLVEDTGWIDLPTTGESAGFTRHKPVRYRKVGPHIYIQGGVHREGAGWAENSQYTIGTLPIGFRPMVQTAISFFCEPSSRDRPPVTGWVTGTGEVKVMSPSTAAYWVVLGGSWLVG